MGVLSLQPRSLSAASVVTEFRREWFDLHVPWHRVGTVVDITDDSGRLLANVLEDYETTTAVVVDLTGDVRQARARLAEFGARVDVRVGGVLDPLPTGADYYLLPDGIEDLDAGRLRRLMRSVAKACLPNGRAIACLPTADVARLALAADRAGMEVTRQSGEDTVSLIEFGSGFLKVLPSE